MNWVSCTSCNTTYGGIHISDKPFTFQGFYLMTVLTTAKAFTFLVQMHKCIFKRIILKVFLCGQHLTTFVKETTKYRYFIYDLQWCSCDQWIHLKMWLSSQLRDRQVACSTIHSTIRLNVFTQALCWDQSEAFVLINRHYLLHFYNAQHGAFSCTNSVACYVVFCGIYWCYKWSIWYLFVCN